MSEPDGTGTLVCVGTSHRVAPVPYIERALRGAERYRRAWRDGSSTSVADAVSELVLLATCNRVEVWVASNPDAVEDVVTGIREALADGDTDPDRLYTHRDAAALRHLCRVAVGLDSMVVGEPQIAGQVARAFEDVLHANGGAPVLGAAARTARLASRRVRSETAISRRPASISTVAVHVAAERAGGLAGARVLVVGAGKIGRLACQALRASGARLTIVNRTLARAESLAERVGARARPLATLGAEIARNDVVITSTASPRPIVDADMLRSAADMRDRATDLLVIDIAVPRNVAPDAAAIPGVTLLGIEDLRLRVQAHIEERCSEIPRAEAIIEDVLRGRRHDDARTLTVIGDLRRRAERIRRRAVQRTLAGLPETDRATRDRIEYLSRTLVNRLLHDPTARLRSAADNESGDEYARVVRDLFALEPESPDRPRPS